MKRFETNLVAFACLTLFCACSEDEAPPCDEHDSSDCDIRSASCQGYALCLVETVRQETGWELPPIRIISLDQLHQYLLSQVEEPTQQSRHWDEILSLLGLIGADSSLGEDWIQEAMENVGAFYDTETRDIAVVDRGFSGDPGRQVYALVHELVHAAQDKEFGLAQWMEQYDDATDSWLALKSLVEGEAVLYSNLAELAVSRIGVYEIDWYRYHVRWLQVEKEHVTASDSPYAALALSVIYPLGSRHVTDLFLALGHAGLNTLFQSPPLETQDWMSNRFDGELDPVPEPVPPDPPLGFEAVYTNRFGALVLFAFLTALDQPADVSWAKAQGWRYDRLWTWADFRADNHLARWLIRWRTAAEAESFAEIASNVLDPATARISVEQDTTALTVSDDPFALDQLGEQGLKSIGPGKDFTRPPQNPNLLF